MSSPPDQTTTAADLGAVVEAIRGRDRFLVTTHENPDGDALGSMLAMKLALDQLGDATRSADDALGGLLARPAELFALRQVAGRHTHVLVSPVDGLPAPVVAWR